MAKVVFKQIINGTLALALVGCSSNAIKDAGTSGGPGRAGSTPSVAVQPLPPAESGQVVFDNRYFASRLGGAYAASPALQGFMRAMVQKHGFSMTYLNGLFSTANRLESVIRLESPPPPTGPVKPRLGSWTRYRDKFLTEGHIRDGVEFWRDNAEAIERASNTYGVDPEYIVGIIGVETYFGKNFGKTCIFDALTTLSFDTYRRDKYFQSELEHFLLMARDEHIDPRQPQGSWAGAMGYGQFMPSSFRKLAVDFNNDGRRDLWSPEDAIGSVAHYFSRNGWQFNAPVTRPSQPAGNPAVIELSTYNGNEYWLIHGNFKVIKRYNNSNKYAMAVHQLAQAIKQRYLSS